MVQCGEAVGPKAGKLTFTTFIKINSVCFRQFVFLKAFGYLAITENLFHSSVSGESGDAW
jgi:hypothetical protein